MESFKKILNKGGHQPRLDTVLMVENHIQKQSGDFSKYQLWRNLPKSVMYQTYLKILDYLEYSNKIAFDVKKKNVWIFNPEIYDKFNSKKELSR